MKHTLLYLDDSYNERIIELDIPDKKFKKFTFPQMMEYFEDYVLKNLERGKIVRTITKPYVRRNRIVSFNRIFRK